MSYNNNNPPGRCIVKNYYKYGNIYVNINKYNKHHIKTKNNDIVNSYNIPSGYDANKLLLKDVITIIETYNITFNNDTPITANIKNETSDNSMNENKGKVLGKNGNETLFLNHSKYNDKYYLKLTNTKDYIPIPKDVNIDKLTFYQAKNIIDNHMQYNNLLIGTRDDKEVILKNGKFGLYLIHDQKLNTLPKFALEKLIN